MCGIVGVFSFSEASGRVDPARLAKMRDTMAHRGPDGSGLWLTADRRLGLAHRRLAIIDPAAAANQPMGTPDGRFQIVFNGEIYNHADIRKELIAAGRTRWTTDHSDTEVILQSFAHWGIDCLQQFRGMFAFALWDGLEQKLWLVRDRIGIKPLYYSFHHGRLTFASEIKALLVDPDQDRVLNEEAFFHYLSFLTSPAPQTLFAGIQKLEPGTWLCVHKNGSLQRQRYWDVWEKASSLGGQSEAELCSEILSELRRAVQLRKVSDVPVGIFLSGGVDSSTNAALFSEGEQGPVKTFSIGYDQTYASYPNETQYARLFAEKLGTEHHERLLSLDDLLAFLPKMIDLQDEPIGDPVCVPVYYLSELARKHGVTVCQVGEGADELFAGYPAWSTLLKLQRADTFPLPRPLKRLGLGLLSAAGRDQGPAYEWLRRGSVGQPVFWGGAEAFYDRPKRQLLSPRLRKRFHSLTSWDALSPIWRRFQDKAWDTSPLSWMTYLDLNLRLPELLLMRVDKMTMGASVEARVPFLDHRFVELALSIPPNRKVAHSTPKYILKKSVRGLIPDQVIDRPKQGFGVPIHEWFFDRLGPMARGELRQLCMTTDLVDSATVDRLFERRASHHVWYLLVFALWWKGNIARLPIAA